jgi:1,4-dihydroxy-2-naphthoyl-CoA hydrolase
MIWHKALTTEMLNSRGAHTMVEYLDIRVTEVGADFIVATMPVDHRTKQPAGLLHGGASVVLAESIASMAGNCVVGPNKMCVGLEINANHLRPVTDGHVVARTTPLHIGKSTQVWQTEIRHNGKLSCVSRMTLAVIDRK